jgi:3-deoxy-D-arabino-heptulosonate 7-phosphate (DAHP) synthase
LDFNFDGFVLEFHPNPNEAKTDQKQQLDATQLAQWLKLISGDKI